MAVAFFVSSAKATHVLSGNSKLENATLENATMEGGAHLSNMRFKSLTVHGALNFTDLKVHQNLHIDGSVRGAKLNCISLNVNGAMKGTNITTTSAKIHGSMDANTLSVTTDLNVDGALTGENLFVEGKTRVSGVVNVINSRFKDMVIESNIATFNNSNAKNITIKAVMARPQKLYLKGYSKAHDVIFESGDGEIYLDKNAQILGNVKGAKIIRN
ncbi:MAG: hypothetical protein RLZZ59_741 [Pseudomonadota bacterium]|jgi:cytoskeletal protein CcmA (bactofilin family)